MTKNAQCVLSCGNYNDQGDESHYAQDDISSTKIGQPTPAAIQPFMSRRTAIGLLPSSPKWQLLLPAERQPSFKPLHGWLALGFTPDWWHGCGWWYGGNININLNPWWWWQPVIWPGYWVVHGSVLPEPIVYDYGTDIVMESNDVYVDGEQIDSAADYRQQALALANPSDVPPPPAPIDAKDASIIPLGVWALVQQEKATP